MKRPILRFFAAFVLFGCLPARGQAPIASQAVAVKQAFEAFVLATLHGDAAAMRARMDYQGPLATQLADAIIQSAQAQAHLRRSAEKAFPRQDLAPLVWGTPEQVRQALDSADIVVEGSTATITLKDNRLEMVQIGGQWKQSVIHSVRGETDAQIERLCGELNHQADIYNALAAEVAVDKYHTPRQAAEILRQELLKPATRPTTRP